MAWVKMSMEKQTTILVIVLIASLALLVGYVLLNKPSSGIHSYITATDAYDIQEIKTNTGVYYKIKVHINNNPEPSYIYTRYEPKQLEDVDIEDVRDKILRKKEAYVTINPYAGLTGKTTIAALEIDKFLDNPYLYNIPLHSSFTEEYQGNTIKTCDDADENTVIFWLKLGDRTKLYSEGECIILEGKTEEDLIKLADRLAFHLLGMMD